MLAGGAEIAAVIDTLTGFGGGGRAIDPAPGGASGFTEQAPAGTGGAVLGADDGIAGGTAQTQRICQAQGPSGLVRRVARHRRADPLSLVAPRRAAAGNGRHRCGGGG